MSIVVVIAFYSPRVSTRRRFVTFVRQGLFYTKEKSKAFVPPTGTSPKRVSSLGLTGPGRSALFLFETSKHGVVSVFGVDKRVFYQMVS